ncbi:Sphingosine kinase 1, partial [Ataeniobius toweri]|nr:Sphingosine kinase 1 [Ataeniobius toweri]
MVLRYVFYSDPAVYRQTTTTSSKSYCRLHVRETQRPGPIFTKNPRTKERQNHARELVREADLSQWDALVIMSGDGLLHEVINGLLERPDWEDAICTPLGILPGGSGNALAASVHYYSG